EVHAQTHELFRRGHVLDGDDSADADVDALEVGHRDRRFDRRRHELSRKGRPFRGAYLPDSVVGFFSSAALGGFGGLGRFIERLTPFQNGVVVRSTSCRPCTRYSRIALSHCSPAFATSFIQSPRAVSSGASVTPSHTVTFGCRVMKSWLCGLAR